MGAVGKQGILICTKMQLSFATGRRLQGSGWGRPPAGRGGCLPAAPPPAGTGEVQGAGREGAGISRSSAGRAGWRDGTERNHLPART